MRKSAQTAFYILLLSAFFLLGGISGETGPHGTALQAAESETENRRTSTHENYKNHENLSTLSGSELQRIVRESLNRWKKVSDTQAEGVAREFLALFRALESDTEIPPRLRKNLTRSVRTKLDALSRQILKVADSEKAEKTKNPTQTATSERPQTVRQDKKQAEIGQFGGINAPMNGDFQETETQSGEELVDVIQNTIHPDSWEQNGGNGTIRYWTPGNHLIIRQTDENHEEIQNLLNQLRRAGS